MHIDLIDLLLAIIGLLLFRYKNPQLKYINTISVLIFILFLNRVLLDYSVISSSVAQVVAIPALITLSIIYALRFLNKEEKSFIDYCKPFALALLILYIIPFYYASMSSSHLLIVLHFSTYSIIFYIYIYDRWILNTMKSKFVIILVAQSVVILLMLTYAFFQKSIADEQTLLAQNNMMKAMENEKRCQEAIKACENNK